jgi:hypothetical protein
MAGIYHFFGLLAHNEYAGLMIDRYHDTTGCQGTNTSEAEQKQENTSLEEALEHEKYINLKYQHQRH